MPRQAPGQSRLAPPALSSRDYVRSRWGEDNPRADVSASEAEKPRLALADVGRRGDSLGQRAGNTSRAVQVWLVGRCLSLLLTITKWRPTFPHRGEEKIAG